MSQDFTVTTIQFKKIVGITDFSDQFRKIIIRYKRIGYNLNATRQYACLVFNPITVINLLHSYTLWQSRLKAKHYSWLGLEIFCLLLGPPGFY